MKKNRIVSLLGIVLTVIMFSQCSGPAKDYGSMLEEGFLNPPDSARPRVWWHWMNGNIKKEGIKADLLWMDRVGIAGFQNFDAGLTTPQVVDKRLVYMTPEWKDAFLFTTRLADSLGLEMAIAGSPGWSESGGPWVTPEQAMKKYVWSEIHIEGGKPFSGILPKPPSTTGAFQNLGSTRGFTLNETTDDPLPEYYADAAVIAFRLPESDRSLAELKPKVTSSGGSFTLEMLTDGDLATSVLLPHAAPGQQSWVQYEFEKPVAVQALTIVGGGSGGMFGFGADPDNRSLLASDDGITFRTVTAITSGGPGQKTLAFEPVTAKYFRFAFVSPRLQQGQDMGGILGMFGLSAGAAPTGTQIAELVLHTGARVNRFEEKAAFSAATDLAQALTPQVVEAISKDDVIDLTSQMASDGSLQWTPPEGKWVILRLGYTLTGHQNSPASPEATGLEVDKLSAEHVRAYFTNYLDQYKDATGGLMGERGLQYVITDSWEAGTQNWTDKMAEEFTTRRGYDILQWMPVLAGYVVESAGESDRFLWDFRKTIGELTVENHYDQLTDILKERDMGRYTESHESGRALIADGMEVKRSADIPMSATWTPGGFMDSNSEVAIRYRADVRESASVSHIYGQSFVAAESMTAAGTGWAWSPELLKPTADMEMANGLNRFVIHTSVHQPLDDKIPGLSLGPFGQWFTRHETWAEQAGPWMDYLARSSFMLMQGEFIADIAYFYGEDHNITALFGEELPRIPEGYNYDFINADALINALTVKKGIINTPAGTAYRILALDPHSQQMSLPVLKKIREMVSAGAAVTGLKPVMTPSLSDDENEFNTIVNELWANEAGENKVGKGKVYAGMGLQEVLDAMAIQPDFTYDKPSDDTRMLFVHRKLGTIDFYWVNNRNNRIETIEASFRVEGREAEIWHPETGLIEKAAYTTENGVTKVRLILTPSDAVFVVFRNKADGDSHAAPVPEESQLAAIEGPWEVKFQEKRGAPATATFATLTPWNENADNGIKFFSGTGTYAKSINAPADWFSEGKELWIDLGSVKNLAEIVVNGQSAGIVWKAPFRVNIGDLLKEGENNIELKVTNLWVNRLIGDAQPNVREKITYTSMAYYQADSPLQPSGLLGPVKLISITY